MNSTTTSGAVTSAGWDELKRQLEEAQKRAQQTCPNCGYCPHCGRSAQRFQPYYSPWWQSPYQPTWVSASDTFTGAPVFLSAFTVNS